MSLKTLYMCMLALLRFTHLANIHTYQLEHTLHIYNAHVHQPYVDKFWHGQLTDFIIDSKYDFTWTLFHVATVY